MTDVLIKEAERLPDAAVVPVVGGAETKIPVDPGDRVWVGFDLGGTKMNAVLYDHKFDILARRKKKTRGADGAAAGVERIQCHCGLHRLRFAHLHGQNLPSWCLCRWNQRANRGGREFLLSDWHRLEMLAGLKNKLLEVVHLSHR